MTYNIHTGKGMDNLFSLQRIVDDIRRGEAQLAGLQEVDRHTTRNPLDEPARLEELSGYNVVFSKNLDFQGGEYGIAVMSRYPIIEEKRFHYDIIEGREPRGALAVKVKPPHMSRPLWFVTTHLGTGKTGREQTSQVKQLLAWIQKFDPEGILILSGDFNQEPDSPAIKLIGEQFVDVWSEGGDGDGFTFNAREPERRIDYLFVEKEHLSGVLRAYVLETIASDHRPLAATIVFE